jgi:two-component SAPR family response regulator
MKHTKNKKDTIGNLLASQWEINGFELYTEMKKIDDQINICFITAGEMYLR